MRNRYNNTILLVIMLIISMSVSAFAGTEELMEEPSLTGQEDVLTTDDERAEDSQTGSEGLITEELPEADKEEPETEGTEITTEEAEEPDEVPASDDGSDGEPDADCMDDTVSLKVQGNGRAWMKDGICKYRPDKGYRLEAIYIRHGQDESAADEEELNIDQLDQCSYEEGTVLSFYFIEDDTDTCAGDHSDEALFDGVWDEKADRLVPGGGND